MIFQQSSSQKGFQRIKNLATSGLIGVSMLAGGSARAAQVNLGFNSTTGGVAWKNINNNIANDNNIIANAFGIKNATLGSGSGSSEGAFLDSGLLSNPFDGALGLNVNGTDFNNPDGDVDLTGTTVTTDIATIAGLEVKVQYHFFSTRSLVRAVFTFTNPTASAIPLTATTGGKLRLTVGLNNTQATSDGDTLIEDTDLWYIISDRPTGNNLPNNHPVLTFARYGTGAAIIPTNTQIPGTSNNGDFYSYQYSTLVPAGKTYKIMTFIELNSAVTNAAIKTSDFESLTSLNNAGLLTGLTSAEQALIVNYTSLPTATPVSTTTTPVPVMTVWGIGSLSVMLSLFGFRQCSKSKKQEL